MGHEVKLTPPIYVKPYVKRGKSFVDKISSDCPIRSLL